MNQVAEEIVELPRMLAQCRCEAVAAGDVVL